MSSLSAIQRDIGRLEGKIDTFLNQMKAQDDRTTDLEVRTRKVENKQYWLSGVGSVLGLLLGRLGVSGLHT